MRALSLRRGEGAALLLGSRLLPLHTVRTEVLTLQYFKYLNVSIVVVVLQCCYFTSHPIGLDMHYHPRPVDAQWPHWAV